MSTPTDETLHERLGAPDPRDVGDDTLTPEQLALLAEVTKEACTLTGQEISPRAVQLAANLAAAVERTSGIESRIPHATLFHICEMACRLEGQPALVIAGAMTSLTQKLIETHAKPARSKLPKWGRTKSRRHGEPRWSGDE